MKEARSSGTQGNDWKMAHQQFWIVAIVNNLETVVAVSVLTNSPVNSSHSCQHPLVKFELVTWTFGFQSSGNRQCDKCIPNIKLTQRFIIKNDIYNKITTERNKKSVTIQERQVPIILKEWAHNVAEYQKFQDLLQISNTLVLLKNAKQSEKSFSLRSIETIKIYVQPVLLSREKSQACWVQCWRARWNRAEQSRTWQFYYKIQHNIRTTCYSHWWAARLRKTARSLQANARCEPLLHSLLKHTGECYRFVRIGLLNENRLHVLFSNTPISNWSCKLSLV